MRSILLLIIAIPLSLFAQDSLTFSQFRFNCINASGKIMTADSLEAKISEVFFTDSTGKDLGDVFTQLNYSRKDSCWILQQEDPLGYYYRIDIYRKADTISNAMYNARKMTIVYPGYDMENKTGCMYCTCFHIPFQPGIYYIDMPRKSESWIYIRSADYSIKNKPVSFKDISGIQNWLFRDGN